MRDRHLRHAIGIVLIAGLTITTGCGVYKRAAKKTCKAFKECTPAQFDQEYRSMGHCVDDIQHYLELIEEQGTKDCAKALAEYQVCAAKEAKKTCSWEVEDEYGYATFSPECAKEFSVLEDFCEGVDLSGVGEYDDYGYDY